ncbi:hypothetical protein ACO0K0_08015 [Undibacterium sp. SXout11W]|uniref:hypothetical protein n=1 Tax=Undibacterium sp. SXout11W TaxID=3413050 RepID=UPI003BF3AECD
MERSSFVELFDDTSLKEFGTKLREASDASPGNAAEAFDAQGLEIAKRYHLGQMSFEDADWGVNNMWSAMCHGHLTCPPS